jgi:predicted RNA-binding protein with TRAM domain
MARFQSKKGFNRPRFGIPKPIKVGEEYDVEIKEVGSKGDGIARIENFVVFVPDTKKGDKTRIKITDVKNRFALAEKTTEIAKDITEEAVEEVKKELELIEEKEDQS